MKEGISKGSVISLAMLCQSSHIPERIGPWLWNQLHLGPNPVSILYCLGCPPSFTSLFCTMQIKNANLPVAGGIDEITYVACRAYQGDIIDVIIIITSWFSAREEVNPFFIPSFQCSNLEPLNSERLWLCLMKGMNFLMHMPSFRT